MNPTTCQTARSCATSQRVWNWVERVGTTRCEISSSRGLREWGIGWDERVVGREGGRVERVGTTRCEISSSRGLREWGIGWDESDIGTAGVSVYERMRNSVCAFV